MPAAEQLGEEGGRRDAEQRTRKEAWKKEKSLNTKDTKDTKETRTKGKKYTDDTDDTDEIADCRLLIADC